MRDSRLLQALIGLALGFVAVAPAPCAEAKAFTAPPGNLLFQLQKQNLPHPWLRVTADSARWELRAATIDEHGLAGLQSRTPGSPLRRAVAWRSIERIDEIVTRADRDRTRGFLLGAVGGAIVGNVIGSGIRTRTGVGQGYQGGDVSSTSHGGMGAALGIAVFGGLGAVVGGRHGERNAHERNWYMGVPATAVEESTLLAVGGAQPADSAGNAGLAHPPASPAPRGSSLSGIAPSPRVVRACESIGRDQLIRAQGDFGEFRGYAAVVGPEGMEGLRALPGRAGLPTSVAPAGLVTWDRIDALDKRWHAWRKGALVGGLLLGTVGGLLGYAETTTGIFESHSPYPPLWILGGVVGGFAYGGVVGAALGAPVGWQFPAWQHVYVRPRAAKSPAAR